MGNCAAKDERLTRAEFVGFFTRASSGQKTTAVFQNLRHHNVRANLVRMRDEE